METWLGKLVRKHRLFCTLALIAIAFAVYWGILRLGQTSEKHLSDVEFYIAIFALVAPIACAVGAWQWGGLLQRRFAAPDEPWRWRNDWARGEVVFSMMGVVITRWCIAIGIAAGGFGFAVMSGAIGRDENGRLALHGSAWALTALAGAFVVYAVLGTRRWTQLGGRTVLKLMPSPGRVGGRLSCVVNLASRRRAMDGFDATLVCGRDVLQNDKVLRVVERSLKAVGTIPLSASPAGRGRLDIPLTFDIPADCLPTTTLLDDETVEWVVTVRSCSSEDDFAAGFEVPVFRVHAPPATGTG